MTTIELIGSVIFMIGLFSCGCLFGFEIGKGKVRKGNEFPTKD